MKKLISQQRRRDEKEAQAKKAVGKAARGNIEVKS